MARKRNSRKKSRKKRISSTPGRSPISLCMIVKDEEKFLDGCLKSVQGLVGEIVIVDTGSSDRTLEIARRYHARIFSVNWQNDFAAARNFALKQCRLPWILYLDADERLEPRYHASVLQAVKKNETDAYYIKVHSPVSRRLGNIPHIQSYPRLFRRLPGVRFEGKIHEQISPSLIRANARFQNLDVTIDHLGYNQEDEIIEQKINRNLHYLREQLKNEPRNAYVYFQLGQTLILNNKFEEGVGCLQQALDLKMLPDNLTATVWLILANIDYEEKRYDDALIKIENALRIAPKQRLGYFLKSECLAYLTRYDEALEAIGQLERYAEESFSDISIDKSFDKFLISQRKGLYHFNRERFEEAFEAFSDYFRRATHWKTPLLEKWVHAWKNLPVKPPDTGERLRFFLSHFHQFDAPDVAGKILAGVALEIERTDLMKQFLQLSLQQNPEDAMALYYLGNAALEEGDYPAAETYFRQAAELDESVWEIHYNLVVSKIKQQDFAGALNILEKTLPKFPEQRVRTQRLLAGLYTKLGFFEKALEYVSAQQIK